jgi:hypothetical protein
MKPREKVRHGVKTQQPVPASYGAPEIQSIAVEIPAS